MRLGATKTGATTTYNGLGDQLYDLGGARPTLDLNFASNGSLVDSVTGKTLVTHTRASSGTYVDGDGIIKDAVTNLLLRSEELGTTWFSSSVTVTNNTTDLSSPFNDNTVTKIVSSGGGAVGQSVTLSSNLYTGSIYLRCDTGSVNMDLIVYLASSPFTNIGTQNITVTTEWQRFSVTTSQATAAQYNFQLHNIPSSTIYAWGAQLEESSTVGEYVKTTSTINSAPRFDHKVTRTTTNLLTYSEDFSQWLKTNTTVTVDSSVELAPDGTATADKIVETAVTDYHFVDNPTPNPTVTNGSVFTASFYVKAAERTTFHAYLVSSGIVANSPTQFDLSTGTVVSGSQATIENVGNGWYRCSIYGTANSTVGRIRILLNGNSSYAGDGTSGLYLWGAQLEQNSDVGPYVKTTGAAATKVDAESLGLLVEESRTNLVPYSEDLSAWTGGGGGTEVLDSAITDPAGNTGTVYYPSISECTQVFNANGASKVAVSCFVKQRSGETANTQIEIFQSVTGTVVSLGATELPLTGTFAPTGNFSNGTRTEYPNGWYRFTFLANADSGQGTGTFTTAARIDIEGGVSTNYVWGVQVENAAFPTSYIRTSGSTVTRSADVTSITGTNFSSWYNQTEGTVFGEGGPTNPTINKTQLLLTINDDSANNRVYLGKKYDSTTAAEFGVTSGGVGQAFVLTTPSSISSARLAAGYKVNNFAVASSGGALTTDTSGSVPISSTQLLIGTLNTGSNNIGGHIRRLTYWPTRLSNDTLQTITR